MWGVLGGGGFDLRCSSSFALGRLAAAGLLGEQVAELLEFHADLQEAILAGLVDVAFEGLRGELDELKISIDNI